ncbi:MAG TPA: aldo/keto reductase [Vicinamibacteria bacterium]|nr:aldo/keto reductase [Vicinamibacteria bacterium]
MAKRDTVSRREFLEKTSLAAAALPALAAGARAAEAAAAMPRRTLGRTGVSVPILAMGCGSRFLMYPAEQATAVLEKAIGLGITYLDTAIDYGAGESETRVGRVMVTRRKDVFLATKVPTRARTRDAALQEVEASLKRLQTDHVDLLHLHSLGQEDDLAKIEAKDGAIKALYELRDQKVARFIGMTSHTDGATMAQAIERNDLDCVQMAMNPARVLGFEPLALPAAKKKDLGVILMKVTGQERLLGADGADPAALLRYAWTLPVATVVCGMPKLEFLDANVASARAFTPMPQTEIDALRTQLAGRRIALEQFFAHHHDGMA